MTDVIVIYGGLSDEPMRAEVGGETIYRRPGESLDAFVSYCRSLQRDPDDIAVIGGLPDD
jgi:hypothetical protein